MAVIAEMAERAGTSLAGPHRAWACSPARPLGVCAALRARADSVLIRLGFCRERPDGFSYWLARDGHLPAPDWSGHSALRGPVPDQSGRRPGPSQRGCRRRRRSTLRVDQQLTRIPEETPVDQTGHPQGHTLVEQD